MHLSRHRPRLALAATMLAVLAIPACGSESGSPESGELPRPTHTPAKDKKKAAQNAYTAGYQQGQAVREAGGKGSSVREVVWGGCTRRALRAGREAEADRGAWVSGCLDGVSENAKHLPNSQVTKRSDDRDLLERFHAWLSATGKRSMRVHVIRLTLVELHHSDYDIELATDYSPAGGDRPTAINLAQSFVKWWDGDDGDGTTWNVVVRGAGGEKLASKSL
ncbi:hypothetical protein AB0G60_30220 [Streptomyces angustmyceticus]|uniref:Lipoprotein n=1 Tax=Streptomyces angustmyceticus TaxID=285578 RepID=A0A5J4LEI1_9ACTN|nr:hypothetical protein [Streptomyces angustmyceticus]UAL70847.1 hypothetical protein K7396_33310 [Streptomyces angustmyceticus]GES29816.1 hypothetical protein San01_23030 [Streptomyces angustmyceticus]